MNNCPPHNSAIHSANKGLGYLKALLFGATLALSFRTQAQVTISSSDMFNQVGQYYRAYSNAGTNTVPVSGLLGTTGGPQAWDFSSGPVAVTNRFNYIPASQGSNGADFVARGATI